MVIDAKALFLPQRSNLPQRHLVVVRKQAAISRLEQRLDRHDFVSARRDLRAAVSARFGFDADAALVLEQVGKGLFGGRDILTSRLLPSTSRT